jgi:hypothetical protein
MGALVLWGLAGASGRKPGGAPTRIEPRRLVGDPLEGAVVSA